MEAKDFYFEVLRQVSGTTYLITPKLLYDTEGVLSDESGVADEVLPKGFYELTKSTYQFEGTAEDGRQILLDIGMKEISFGFQPGEPSVNSSNDEGFPGEEVDEEVEDELDILLKDVEPDAFDYKNISTDKLMRHLSIMISTDAFEEAAKIRDELTSRGVNQF